jgi:5-methylcytosine-specific restriction endonuclease McrA
MSNLIRTCRWCLKSFETIYDDKLYCHRSCKELAQQSRRTIRKKLGIAIQPGIIRRKVKTLYIRKCKNCGEYINSYNPNKLYCDTYCSNMLRELNKRQGQVKRFEKASAPNIVARLYYKHNGLCGICKQPIDLRIKHPDMMSLSIDHIIPVSKGGTNFQKNLQPTHLICNLKKSNKIDK